jgi:hypothetical protein
MCVFASQSFLSQTIAAAHNSAQLHSLELVGVALPQAHVPVTKQT